MGRGEQCFALLMAVYGVLLSLVWLYDAIVDGAELSYARANVVLGRCPVPYLMEGRSCLMSLVTTRHTLVENAVVVLGVSFILGLFALKRRVTGAVVLAALCAWRAGVLIDGAPFGVVVIFCLVASLQRIRRQRPRLSPTTDERL